MSSSVPTCARTYPAQWPSARPITFEIFGEKFRSCLDKGDLDSLALLFLKNKNIFREDLQKSGSLIHFLGPYLNENKIELEKSDQLAALIEKSMDSHPWCKIALTIIAFEKGEDEQGYVFVEEMVASDQCPWNLNFRTSLIEVSEQCDTEGYQELKWKVQILLTLYNQIRLTLPIPSSIHTFNIRSRHPFA